MATVADVRELLRPTSLPATLVDDLLAGVSPLWLMGESAEAVAGDLILCHPPLGVDEIRVTIHRATDPDLWHLTVLTKDRVGLLAATAGVLGDHELSIQSASATTWAPRSLALQRLLVSGAAPSTAVGETAEQTVPSNATDRLVTQRWERICADLRVALGPGPVPLPSPAFAPAAPVRVSAISQGGSRSLVRVRAPDRPGLVWAITEWLAQNGCAIELARIDGQGGRADDTFVVVGTVDTEALSRRLAGERESAVGPSPALSLLTVLSRLWRYAWSPWGYLRRRR